MILLKTTIRQLLVLFLQTEACKQKPIFTCQLIDDAVNKFMPSKCLQIHIPTANCSI